MKYTMEVKVRHKNEVGETTFYGSNESGQHILKIYDSSGYVNQERCHYNSMEEVKRAIEWEMMTTLFWGGEIIS